MRTIYFILLFLFTASVVKSQLITQGYGFFEEPYMGINLPKQSVTDREGNTYVTGTSSDENSPQGNIFTVKFNKNGTIEWSVREETLDFAVEFGYAVTLDENDNPIVAGSYWNGQNMDIKTIKYHKDNGTIIWSSVFDSGHNGLDYPKSLATDSQGNVIVAGHSIYDENSIGYSVVKYDAQGNFLWMDVLENEVSETSSQPVKVVCDADGNIGITGTDVDPMGYSRYYTVKYSESGELLWKKYYSSGSPYSFGSRATDAAFDDSGNLYVTGTFDRGDFENNKIGTIKYNPSGDVEWINGYESAENTLTGEELKIDGNKVYVAGIYDDFTLSVKGALLIAYSLDGNEDWIQRTADMVAEDVKLEIDKNSHPVLAAYGSVFIDWDNTFVNFHVHRYDENGELLDEKSFQRNNNTISIEEFIGIGIDFENDIFIISNAQKTGEGNMYEVFKFPESGTDPDWVSYYGNWGAGNTNMLDSQTDGSGNTIVLGDFGTFDESLNYITNYFLAKYDASGQMAWKNVLSSGESGPIIKTNASGETIVLFSSFTDSTLTAQKYSTGGELLWQFEKSLSSPQFNQLLIDDNGNIYAVGESYDGQDENTPRYSLIKISADGEEVWEWYKDVNTELAGSYLSSIEIDSNKNIILSGTHGLYQQARGFLFSVSDYGELNWSADIAIGDKNVRTISLSLDEENNIYVLNQTETMDDQYATASLVVKFNSAGNEIWQKTYAETGNAIDPNKIMVFDDESVSIVLSNFNERNKITIVKYDAEGNELSISNSGLNRFYRDAYTDDMGNIYVLSQAEHQAPIPYRTGLLIQASVLKIDTGDNINELIFQGPNLSLFTPNKFVPHSDGRLQISGDLCHDNFSFWGLYFFETTHETLGSNETEPDAEMNYLGQNYPNPASYETTIPFKIKETGRVSLDLYDVSGKYIKNLFNGNLQRGEHKVPVNISGLPAGIYFYQLSSANFKASKKMIVK